MAEGGPKSISDLLECQICLEDFEEDVNHIPRSLPCSHTFCETCIKQLLQQGGGNRLTCPNCKRKHRAKHPTRSFPQNKYTLALVRQKTQQRKKDSILNEKCEEHGRKLEFYCKDDSCQKILCMTCVRTQHKAHDWVGIEEEGREILNTNIGSVEDQLNVKLNEIAKTKEETKKKVEHCVNELKTKRDELKQQLDEEFNKMIQEAEKYTKTAEAQADVVDDHFLLLNSLKLADSELSVPEFINSMDILKSIRRSEEQEPPIRAYKYPVYEPGQLVDLDKMCGRISQEETEMEVPTPESALPVSRPIRNASELLCIVTMRRNTGFCSGRTPLLSLINNMVAFCSHSNPESRLTIYNSNGREMFCLVLDHELGGMTDILLNNKPALALADRNSHKIEFRDAADLNTVIQQHSMAPHTPTQLCAASRNHLFYVDIASTRPEVRLLDCSTIPPKLVEGRYVIHKQHSIINDMCCVQDGDKQLLVTVYPGIQVYDTGADKLLWKVGHKKLPGMDWNMYITGVTSDGRGHLYVCDHWKNRCIQMFRTSDGEYLGCLIRQGEQGLGCPHRVRWCQNLTSLVVLHLDDRVWCVSVIEVKS